MRSETLEHEHLTSRLKMVRKEIRKVVKDSQEKTKYVEEVITE